MEDLLKKLFEIEDSIVKSMPKGIGEMDFGLGLLRMKNFEIGYYSFFKESNMKDLKQRAYNVAILGNLLVRYYTHSPAQFLSYDIPGCLFVLHCDHEETIRMYAKLRYRAFGRLLDMEGQVAKGQSPIWCNTIQYFMENNVEGVEKNLNILETITMKKKKEEPMRVDYNYYRALYEKDQGKCEQLLEQLVSPKIHKKRNIFSPINQFVSQPALGYAKLAWRLGIEVEVDSPFIPRELLLTKPNDSYSIPYAFLKDLL